MNAGWARPRREDGYHTAWRAPSSPFQDPLSIVPSMSTSTWVAPMKLTFANSSLPPRTVSRRKRSFSFVNKMYVSLCGCVWLGQICWKLRCYNFEMAYNPHAEEKIWKGDNSDKKINQSWWRDDAVMYVLWWDDDVQCSMERCLISEPERPVE